MGRNPQPIDVIVAKGAKHLTKEEIEQRRAQELDTSPITDVGLPSILENRDDLAEQYWDIVSRLHAINPKLFSQLDENVLAMYLVAYNQWVQLSRKVDECLAANDLKNIGTVSRAADVAFKQAVSAGSQLGLSTSARCKLVIPTPPEPKTNKFAAFA